MGGGTFVSSCEASAARVSRSAGQRGPRPRALQSRVNGKVLPRTCTSPAPYFPHAWRSITFSTTQPLNVATLMAMLIIFPKSYAKPFRYADK